MMDPVVLCVIGGAIISLLVVLTYYLFSKEESDFEKVYNTKALALLTEPEKKEKKGKSKNKKDKRQQQLQQREQQKEQQPKEDSETTDEDETKENSQLANTSENVDVKEITPVTVSSPQSIKVSVPVRAADEPKQISPKPSPKQDSPKEGKKKQLKVVNVKDLDQKKVISRLSAVADLEEGYVQFLTATFRDGDMQKSNLSSEVKALSKKLADANQRADKLQKEKNILADKERQEQSKQVTMTSKIQLLQSRESELSQSAHVAQTNLQQREEAHKKEAQQLRIKVSYLENEVHSQKTSNGKLASQLTSVQSQLANAVPAPVEQHTGSEEEIATLKEEIVKFENVVREMKAHHETKMADYLEISQDAARMEKTVSELEESLATSRRELATQTEHEAKQDQAMKELEAENAELLKKTTACQNLTTLVADFGTNVNEFEDKKQQDALWDTLKNDRGQRLELLEAEVLQFHDKESALQKALETERSKVQAAERALAEEKARVVDIPRNSASPEVVEEVFELKKTSTDLAAAPSTSAPSADLAAKVAQLEAKNEELRGRNYTLLEKTEDVPKNLINERKRIVEVVGKLVKKNIKNVDDEAAFFEWLEQAVSGVQKDLAVKKTGATAPKADNVQHVSAPVLFAPAAPSANEAYFRSVVIKLLTELERIGDLVDKSENQKQSRL